jgi:hypothetical protein
MQVSGYNQISKAAAVVNGEFFDWFGRFKAFLRPKTLDRDMIMPIDYKYCLILRFPSKNINISLAIGLKKGYVPRNQLSPV